ncbi:uncharacterized protein LOC116446548 [Corvus moneduloides]|uniref:uncharacterized protein LOC116446548 n=1 Tax=Corvus moneduloides TaxID=1196302 RepID=UPI001364824B|nr:uncharacterized protein LOC116446548 [Corvus moneduloides]
MPMDRTEKGPGQTPPQQPDPLAMPGLSLPGERRAGLERRSPSSPAALSSGYARSLPDAAVDRTQEQDPTRGRFRRTAQMVSKFIKRIREEETSIMGTGVRAYSHIFKTKTSAALLDMLVEEGISSPEKVPAMVRYIHQWLLSNEYNPEYNLSRTLLDLTEAYPTDVVMTLLRVAPSCDRYGAHLPRRPRAHQPNHPVEPVPGA